MDTDTLISPLKSKLGREIYTLAALLASVPLLLIGSISLYEIDAEHRAQVERAMDQTIRSFGEMVLARFRQAGDLASLLMDARLASDELPHSFLDYAVFENGQIVHTTFDAAAEPSFPVTGTTHKPQITMTTDQPLGHVFLSMRSGARTFIGQLDREPAISHRNRSLRAFHVCAIGGLLLVAASCNGDARGDRPGHRERTIRLGVERRVVAIVLRRSPAG